MPADAEITLTSLDGGIEFQSSPQLNASIRPGEESTLSRVDYHVNSDIDPDETLSLKIDISLADVERGDGYVMLPTSPDSKLDSDLNDSPLWLNHESVTPGYGDCWRWAEDAGDGSAGFTTGGPDSTFYLAHVDAVIELPLMMMAGDASLSFRHKMDVEAEYDGGVIEVDIGNGWERVVPEGGYNGTSVEIGDYPGGECWNGSFDWQDARLQLQSESGPIRVRFRFAADNGVEGFGWFIDDIRIDGTPLEVSHKQGIAVQEFELTDLYPNPFNSRINVSYNLPISASVSLCLYDIHGKQVFDMMTGRLPGG